MPQSQTNCRLHLQKSCSHILSLGDLPLVAVLRGQQRNVAGFYKACRHNDDNLYYTMICNQINTYFPNNVVALRSCGCLSILDRQVATEGLSCLVTESPSWQRYPFLQHVYFSEAPFQKGLPFCRVNVLCWVTWLAQVRRSQGKTRQGSFWY